MLVAIIGPPNTCKHALSDVLQKEDAFLPLEELHRLTEDALANQVEILTARYQLQKSVQAVEHDFVQVNTFWDVHEIYSRFYLRSGNKFGNREFKIMNEIYSCLNENLNSPNLVIYAQNRKAETAMRAGLRRRQIVEEEQDCLVELYEGYVKRIRIPVVTVDVSDKFDEAISEVRYAVSNSKGSSLCPSMWKKSFLL
jgi:hypothetical protein